MEVNLKGRHARLLVESTINAIREAQDAHPNTRYTLEAAIFVPPQELTDSGTIAALNALQDAIKKFPKHAPLRLVLNVPVKSSIEEEMLSKIERSFEKVMALELPTEPGAPNARASKLEIAE